MKQPLMAGNWKMFKSHVEAGQLVTELWPLIQGNDKVEAVVCPPFTALAAAAEAIREGGMRIGIGAQNIFYEESGAFTGEVSPLMLQALGMDYVIIGHSERRTIFGETDEWVARKLRAALEHGITPIMCCGESLEERESGTTRAKVEGQIRIGLAEITAAEVAGMVVAYEPIWAIGTGKVATPDDAQDVCGYIRELVTDMKGPEAAGGLRILYGGSVKPDNVAELMEMPDVEGALVGGASLKAADFAGICNY
ncbi:MAG: triose-phosphate isomerase [Candidatus Geothermincolia bacterium]